MPTVRLLLEYDGTGFHGWQVQPGQRTVQGEIETAAARLLQVPVRVRGAGRTDAGAHALGQVAALEVGPGWNAERLGTGLTALLPRDVVVLEASEAAEGFDPRRDARWRLYRYRIGRSPSALERHRRWWMPRSLDMERMRAAAIHLVGEHDFRVFTSGIGPDEDAAGGREAGGGAGDRCRIDMEEASLLAAGDEITMDFRAHHFVTGMVRLLVGTLVGVGRGRLDPDATARALATGERRWVGSAAPAHGLYLVRVGY